MPAYPPPHRYRTDNIKRVHSQRTAEALAQTLTLLRGKSGMWPENDPEAYAAYLRNVWKASRLIIVTRTVSCDHCGTTAVYTLDDLRQSFGSNQNVNMLPVSLLPCRSKRDRRDGACALRLQPGGYPEDVKTVKSTQYG